MALFCCCWLQHTVANGLNQLPWHGNYLFNKLDIDNIWKARNRAQKKSTLKHNRLGLLFFSRTSRRVSRSQFCFHIVVKSESDFVLHLRNKIPKYTTNMRRGKMRWQKKKRSGWLAKAEDKRIVCLTRWRNDEDDDSWCLVLVKKSVPLLKSRPASSQGKTANQPQYNTTNVCTHVGN